MHYVTDEQAPALTYAIDYGMSFLSVFYWVKPEPTVPNEPPFCMLVGPQSHGWVGKCSFSSSKS